MKIFLGRQLYRSFIIKADFNVPHNIWGFTSYNPKGEIISEMIIDENLLLFNSRVPTYLIDSRGVISNIDLTIRTLNMVHYLNWEVNDILHDSNFYFLKIFIYYKSS